MLVVSTDEVSLEDREFVDLLLATAEFEPGAASYSSFMSFNLHAVERGRVDVQRLTRHVDLHGADALDIGAGSGGLAIALAERGARVAAIEPDETRRRWAVARIAGHGVEVRLHASAAEALPFPDASFDLVTMDSVIEHVESPARSISEIARVLRPGGVVFLSWPNKGSLINLWRDPHYQMIGVVLMPRRLGRFYVERVRRSRRAYWVNVIPTSRWVKTRFLRHGIRLDRQTPDGPQKLTHPDSIRGFPRLRTLAHFASRLGLGAFCASSGLRSTPRTSSSASRASC